MATIINKRQHQLRVGAVTLMPGENTVDDEAWAAVNVKGSQVEQWLRLNWVSARRGLPVMGTGAQEPSGEAVPGGGTVAPSAPGGLPIPTQPQGYNPPPGAAAMGDEGDETKRSRRAGR